MPAAPATRNGMSSGEMRGIESDGIPVATAPTTRHAVHVDVECLDGDDAEDERDERPGDPAGRSRGARG